MLPTLLLTAASYAQDAAVEVGSTPGGVSPGTDAAVVLGASDLAADAGSALLAYGAGSLSHWAGRRYGGLVAGAAAVSGRQVWSRSMRGRVR